MTDRRRAAGFTLVEVLVALVILAIASGFAFRTVSGSFDRLSQAESEQQAVTIAESILARLGHDLAVQPGRLTGTEGRMRWRLDVGAALADPPPASGLAAYPVQVLVDWQDGRTPGKLRLQSVQLGPEPSPW